MSRSQIRRGYFQLKPLGPTKVKGVSEPLNVYEVTGLARLRSRRGGACRDSSVFESGFKIGNLE
jgi:hypothetical protein